MNKAFRKFGGLVMALGLIAAGVGFTSAPTSVPTMPVASASISTWQAWSSAEVQYVTTTNWAQVLPSEIGSGQQLVNWGIVSTTSTGAGIIPAGITTDNLWYLTQPDSSAPAATNSVAASTTYLLIVTLRRTAKSALRKPVQPKWRCNTPTRLATLSSVTSS